MLRAPLLLLLVAACSAAPRARSRLPRPRLDGRIVGGEPVDISQYPWQLSLQEVGYHVCGASVISSNWALTAAHCLDGRYYTDLSIRAGTSARESGGTVYDAVDTIQHDNYESYLSGYDVAVIHISGPFSFGNNVQAVHLAPTEPAAGTAVTITGWGTLYPNGPEPAQLQAVTTTVVVRSSCNDAYVYGEITETMICAGEDEGGKDACEGDNGGPLVAGNTQYGVVSWGAGCGSPGYPGVYSNVAALRDWIIDVTDA